MIESLTDRLMAHEEKVTNGVAQNKRSSSTEESKGAAQSGNFLLNSVQLSN